ncbi:MAG: 4,5-DOPA dioxygenase extradiol [Cytophagales bacterium]|uniref:4,5-DOPA-extradiol-dioxygenase n=1 Tax=Cyclobacterium marinum TaxID=104 RepID=UPI0030DCA598|nr:4,5-DOPA dioxygenase extradiol [Cytophagales bacterium]|tara:strand:+ start:246 stop:1073 length:828 start_codon:yes stop_codon:yes gene_type:complete
MHLKALNKLSGSFSNAQKMPVLFLGHGSPLNAIEENTFVANFKKIGKEIPKPKAILCISAHWETKGTYVTAMKKPKTIHDFGGFPQALFDVQYPAPGSPSLARETKDLITKTKIGLDKNWGLDHGTWSVVKHLYPNAEIPTIQMSLDYTKSPKHHFELAKELSQLRQKGVLIIGSGNMVHNLGKVAWDKLKGEPFAFDWAMEANEKIKSWILNGDFQNLINFKKQGKAFDLAIPTPEHYLPLLYALALKHDRDKTSLFNDQPVGGSLSMTSVKFD